MTPDQQFVHHTIDKLSVVYIHLHNLQSHAMANINTTNAIEVRDFCVDLANRIDVFTKSKSLNRGFAEAKD